MKIENEKKKQEEEAQKYSSNIYWKIAVSDEGLSDLINDL